MQTIYTDLTKTANNVSKLPTKLNDFIETIVNKGNEILNSPTIDEIKKIDWSNISAILGTISIILIITIVAIIALYLLRAIALYTMVKKEGKDFAWLAFVPFGCFFTYGLITGKTKIYGIEIDHPEWLIPILLLSSCLPYVGFCSMLLFALAKYGLLYRIYQSKTPNFAAVLLILSIAIPIISPIILFAIRNK